MNEMESKEPILEQIFNTMFRRLQNEHLFSGCLLEQLKACAISGKFNDPKVISEILKRSERIESTDAAS